MKKCNKCGVVKVLGEFRKHHRNACRICLQKQEKQYYEKNKGELLKKYAVWRKKNSDRIHIRDIHRKNKYIHIDADTYQQILAEQNGRCAICNSRSNMRLAVDHCHETGKIRGLLCRTCNGGLGLFGDSQERLNGAARYLAEFYRNSTTTVEN